VPQGLTGWWQVKNRDKQQAYDVRVEDDLFYIHNYSLLLDLRIIWLTVAAILRGNGAY
jgi:lipopolysaccharide/colanic/teichoic acid biosynthesis glycosyltransferase